MKGNSLATDITHKSGPAPTPTNTRVYEKRNPNHTYICTEKRKEGVVPTTKSSFFLARKSLFASEDAAAEIAPGR